ncbi:ABC transporter permease [Pseudonocardia humida]|uniref:Transport permease protein n=1 Tax=Pseudonocardia humida TaxID=2800819 RepID=A0ABT1A3K1_9PSEU|nr:ABC transporter permease [Pseudonocardia humida]MCO1657513.1 ABC transporter permease [Pseudonocardia humida]
MTTIVRAATDSSTMLRRNLLRMVRYPSMTLMLVGMPIVFLLLFVYVFGATLGAGIGAGGSGTDGRTAYLGYVVPGILLMTVAAAANGTAVTVSMDMTQGLIARFKTMPIARVAVLTGHVVGNVVQSLIGVAVVLGVALLLGYRPAAGPLGWLGATGLLALIAFAMTWLSVALGLVAKNVESASNLPMPLTFLPFLGSGFVPTDSLPVGLAWFAEHQPFTPMIEGVRGLLSGTPVGSAGWLAVGWSVLISALGYLWARRLYDRRTG